MALAVLKQRQGPAVFSWPMITQPPPYSPGRGGRACLTWVSLIIHQFANELLVGGPHLGAAAPCGHGEVIEPRVLEEEGEPSVGAGLLGLGGQSSQGLP